MNVSTLQVRALRKRYRGRHGVQANDGIDLDVPAGAVVGLLGHNGAGKTTLVNQIVGLARPDSGTITVAGADAVAHPHRARELVSIQAQANVPITGLTPRKAIELVGRIRGGEPAAVRRRAAELLAALDLGPWADTPAEKVSGGVARLAAFAMAAVVPGRVVVLDEPTNDVDPLRRRLLWAEIRALADSGAAVLLVTHNVREAERVVDHLVVLDLGKVVAAGTPVELSADVRGSLTIEVDLANGVAPSWPAGAVERRASGSRAVASVDRSAAATVVAWAQHEVDAGRLDRYALVPASLEDVYLGLVAAPTDAPTDAAAGAASGSATAPEEISA